MSYFYGGKFNGSGFRSASVAVMRPNGQSPPPFIYLCYLNFCIGWTFGNLSHTLFEFSENACNGTMPVTHLMPNGVNSFRSDCPARIFTSARSVSESGPHALTPPLISRSTHPPPPPNRSSLKPRLSPPFPQRPQSLAINCIRTRP